MTEQDTEIVVVKAQLEAIQKAIDEVKIAVTDLSRVGTSVAIMQQQQDIHAEKIERTTKRVDALSGKLDNNSAYLNKLRGGFNLTVSLVTLIQAVVLAGASWVLTSVIDTREDLGLVKQELRHLELDHSRLIQSLLTTSKVEKNE